MISSMIIKLTGNIYIIPQLMVEMQFLLRGLNRDPEGKYSRRGVGKLGSVCQTQLTACF